VFGLDHAGYPAKSGSPTARKTRSTSRRGTLRTLTP